MFWSLTIQLVQQNLIGNQLFWETSMQIGGNLAPVEYIILKVQVNFPQSAEVRLVVSGGQPLFTLGLAMFALSLVDFLSLLWAPSTNICFFIFHQRYHLKDTFKIFEKIHVGLKLE